MAALCGPSLRGLGRNGTSFCAPLILIDAEDADAVKLGEFGDKHSEEGHGVDHEVDPVVFGVGAGEDVSGRGGRKREVEGEGGLEKDKQSDNDQLL